MENFKIFKRKPLHYRIPTINGTKTEMIGITEWLISDQGTIIIKHYRDDNSLISERQVNQFWKGRAGSEYKLLGIPTGEYVHRLVAINFLDNPGQFKFVEHIDNNRENNNVLNLVWVQKPTIKPGPRKGN
jgi:hypothetical protein